MFADFAKYTCSYQKIVAQTPCAFVRFIITDILFKVYIEFLDAMMSFFFLLFYCSIYHHLDFYHLISVS